MPRTRDIRPGFFKNEDLADCDPFARLLFAGIWCWSDRNGVVEDRPRKLRAEILPYDNCDGAALVDQLVDKGHLVRDTMYEINTGAEVKVLVGVNFSKHQRVHPREEPRYAATSHDLQVANRTLPSLPSTPSTPSLGGPTRPPSKSASQGEMEMLQDIADERMVDLKHEIARKGLGSPLTHRDVTIMKRHLRECEVPSRPDLDPLTDDESERLIKLEIEGES